ncbi:MAG: hypothetical protein O7C75_17590, partial [Verrucomicrobia bacterium]|nr:hypothetical protein [Verrucomicrobiota bacterium]
MAQEEDPCEGDPTDIILISVASNGTPGDGSSGGPSISYCGDKIFFTSSSNNLSPDDLDFNSNLFVHDAQSGETSLVIQAGSFPSTSADGRYVAFESSASLVPLDTNDVGDVFVTDTQTGETKRVSVASNGTETDEWSLLPSISADGRKVAFMSVATNLGSSEFYYILFQEVFVHDTETRETKQVSAAEDGTDSNGNNWNPDISADGRWVAFSSSATNLENAFPDINWDVYVKNLETGAIELVSKSTMNARGDDDSMDPSISSDGRFIAFETDAQSLQFDELPYTKLDRNGFRDIYVHDRQSGETNRVSIASDLTEGDGDSTDASISADGRYVAFKSEATNLVASDTNGLWDIFVHDRWTGQTKRANVAADGTEAKSEFGTGLNTTSSISGDGRYVTFSSIATNLVAVDIGGNNQIFRAPNPFLPSTPVDPRDPSDIFVWSGDEDDGKWETAGNWDDAFTNGPVNMAPGDPD